MIRRLLIMTAATVVVGSLALPVAASSRPPFSLTLFPAKVLVELGRSDVTFNLLNGGSDPQRITVTPASDWLRPDESAFDLAPGATHATTVRIALPATHDSGDLNSTVAFTVTGGGAGALRISRGLEAVVIVSTGINERHGLSWDSLQLPRFIDSTLSGPVRLSVRAVNAGNIHELLDPVLGSVGNFPWENVTDRNETVLHFEATILLRDSSRTLRADWSPPLLCLCTVAVRGQQASVLVFPVRAAGLLLVLLLSLLLVRRWRRVTA